MKKVAVLPLRAGSKGIVGKNKKKLLGRPLYQWVLTEAVFSNLDKIYVFSDDDEILDFIGKEYNWSSKVIGIRRSTSSATDTASTEAAMIEVAEKINYDFDIFCLLQATSPLTNSEDINRCLDKVENTDYDSALTVVETKRFLWSASGESQNYDYTNRPRRQDFNGVLVENGAVYACQKEVFIENKNRLGGRIGVVKMREDTLIEIDEPSDWLIMESLMENRLFQFKKPSKKIKAIVFDVDGVFTDSTVAVSSSGELFKSFSLRDGMGFEFLKQENIIPIIMTSEDSLIVKKRMEKLQLEHVHLGVKDKYSRVQTVLNQLGLTRNELAYLGDDINDLSNLSSVGWGVCPIDAEEEVKRVSDLVMTKEGGKKVVRELISTVIKINRKYN